MYLSEGEGWDEIVTRFISQCILMIRGIVTQNVSHSMCLLCEKASMFLFLVRLNNRPNEKSPNFARILIMVI